MADVFISYARESATAAQRMAMALRSAGFPVWIDDQLPAHGEFPAMIEEKLRSAKAVLVLWSADAVTSRWVPAEADIAHKAGTLVQLTLDSASPPLPFNRLQCVRLRDWDGDLTAPGWLKIAAGIADLVGQPTSPPAATAAAAAAPEAREPLLAVLAFDNLSGDPEVAYFSDGVSEEIQQVVAQGSDLRVIARSSSFQFRGAGKAVRNVAAELKATHLLDGSVRRSGARVRIAAQLVECASGTTLWTNRFDGDLTDIFDLQERIAAAVAQALQITLAPPMQTQVSDPAVFEDFLRARSLISEGGGLFDAAAEDALPLLEEVVRAAPDHAAAWELLAGCRAWTLRSGHRRASYDEGRAGVIEAAETALRLDPKRGGAYGALSLLEPWGAYADRERMLRKALAVTPNDPRALTEMSAFSWSVGRFRDALAFAERACELNPLMPAARLQVAQMRTYVGDYEASIRMHRELYQRWPRNFAILISLLNFACSLDFWDDYNEVVGEAAHFQGWQASFLRATMQYAEALSSNDPQKRADLLARYTAIVEKSGTLPLNYLEALSTLGMTDEAFGLAQKASFAHMFDPDGPMPSGSFPGCILGRWSGLNKSPRFIGLCDSLGLSSYWAKSGQWPDCVDWAPFDFKAEVRRRAAA